MVPSDRALWTVVIVKPETLIAGTTRGSGCSRARRAAEGARGLSQIAPEIPPLIAGKYGTNTTWGASRVHEELLKGLGFSKPTHALNRTR